MQPTGFVRDTDAIIEQAQALGFELARFATDTGQTVWEWRRGDESRPQFATERVAIVWMTEWLERRERPRRHAPTDD